MPKDRKITRANKKIFRGGDQSCIVGLRNCQPKRSISSPGNLSKTPFEVDSIWSSALETRRRKH